MALIGYARVSSDDQQLVTQLESLNSIPCDRIFSDSGISGDTEERDGLQEALNYLREGDTLVVHRMQRLGRNTKNMLTLIDSLKARGIAFRSVMESIDTTTAQGRFFFTILSAVDELDLAVIREKTWRGRELAKKRGVVGGRPAKLTMEQKKSVLVLHQSNTISISKLAEQFGVSRGTIYNALNELKQKDAVTA